VNSLADIYESVRTRCDKNSVHSYIPIYEQLLAPYRDKPVNVLEIGLFWGGSLRMWHEYFNRGNVHGIDLCDQPLGLADLRPMIAEDKYNIHLMDACDQALIKEHFGDMKFDVVIEDASHSVEQQLSLFRAWRPRMNPGGLYVIEDIEDIDKSRETFLFISPTDEVQIVDRRSIKGRFDDVLVVIQSQ
jgi:cephalosporin hydroxylase